MAERPFTAASFNQFLAEKKLMASRCTGCGALHLPPRPICPKCHGETMEWAQASGQGRLAAFTSIYIGLTATNAEGYGRDNPYCAGVVELEEGVKISARVLGVDAKRPASIQIGAPLTVEFVERGEGETKTTLLAFRV
jgi:uncharacterized OB-fold protein